MERREHISRMWYNLKMKKEEEEEDEEGNTQQGVARTNEPVGCRGLSY